MVTATRHAMQSLRARHGLGAVAGVLLAVAVGAAAFAYWVTSGSGSGSALAATLAAPTSVTASASGATVTVSFTGVTSPAGGAPSGYYVTRYVGAVPTDACGTVAGLTGPYLAPAATGCTDSAVPNGTYTYRVTAVFQTWTAQSAASAPLTVSSDSVAPTQVVTMSGSGGTAVLTAGTVYYRGSAAGSFVLQDAVTDAGSGPKHAVFPAIATTGWTHNLQTVAAGSGSAPTVTYPSSTFSWTASPSNPAAYTVTGSDVAGNTTTTTLTFASDVTGPTGGALTVNGTPATAGGATSADRTGGYGLSRTDYASDGAGSGVASSVLTRSTATYTNGACGTFGSTSTVVGSPSESGLSSGCYRYTLTGTDAVGNTSAISVTVRVDVVNPAVVLTAGGGSGFVSGSTLYYRSDVAGSMTLSAAVTDNHSGPASVTFPAVTGTGWTHTAQTVSSGSGSAPTITYTSSAYAWSTTATATAPIGVTAADVAGNTGSSGASLTLTADGSFPTPGALTVNAVGGTAGGNTSNSSTGAWSIATTPFTDTGSGIASNVLTVATANLSGAAGGTCGTFGSATVITGTTSVTGQAGGRCLRYTWTGTDNVGHTTSLSTTVKASPYVVSAALQNGNGANVAGKVEQNDKIVIVYSDTMTASSICSAWTSNAQNYTLQVSDSDATLVDGGAAADSMTFTVGSSGCASGIHIGSISLGATGYNTTGGDITFGKNGKPKRTTYEWAFSTKTLTITLGDESANTAGTVAGGSTAVYTPDPAMTNSTAVPIGGSITWTGVQF